LCPVGHRNTYDVTTVYLFVQPTRSSFDRTVKKTAHDRAKDLKLGTPPMALH